jgi:hypothetical protein
MVNSRCCQNRQRRAALLWCFGSWCGSRQFFCLHCRPGVIDAASKAVQVCVAIVVAWYLHQRVNDRQALAQKVPQHFAGAAQLRNLIVQVIDNVAAGDDAA